jgi:hypothetical protein
VTAYLDNLEAGTRLWSLRLLLECLHDTDDAFLD